MALKLAHEFTLRLDELCQLFISHVVKVAGLADAAQATFVTRLRPRQSPGPVARQLSDLSTIIRVEPSSTGDSRRQSALPASYTGGAQKLMLRFRSARIAADLFGKLGEHELHGWRRMIERGGKCLACHRSAS